METTVTLADMVARFPGGPIAAQLFLLAGGGIAGFIAGMRVHYSIGVAGGIVLAVVGASIMPATGMGGTWWWPAGFVVLVVSALIGYAGLKRG